jgi:hypothetical protein
MPFACTQDIFVTALMSMFAFVSMIGGIFGERGALTWRSAVDASVDFST